MLELIYKYGPSLRRNSHEKTEESEDEIVREDDDSGSGRSAMLSLLLGDGDYGLGFSGAVLVQQFSSR